MAGFIINIVRDWRQGRLTFEHGSISVDFLCWWDPDVVIEAGAHSGYATRMANKDDGYTKDANGKTKREAIWLGKGVPICNQGRTSNDIFIHHGTGSESSDGCIAGDRKQIFEIWICVQPKEQDVIEVIVEDRRSYFGSPALQGAA